MEFKKYVINRLYEFVHSFQINGLQSKCELPTCVGLIPDGKGNMWGHNSKHMYRIDKEKQCYRYPFTVYGKLYCDMLNEILIFQRGTQ